MGATGYRGYTAAQAREAEFMGAEVIARSGAWTIFASAATGQPVLAWTKVTRYGSEAVAKTVTIDMGPAATPPAAFARRYVALYDGDIDAAGITEWGAASLRAALETEARIAAGDRFTVEADGEWADGVPIAGEYIFRGRFRATRADGREVALPRDWRRRWRPTV